jgi:phosphoglycolate phosphatase
MELPRLSEDELRKYIGPPLFDAWREDFSLSDSDTNEMIRIFREYYNIYGWWDNAIYPGIKEMLETLSSRGKILVVATSKPQLIAERVLELFDIGRCFAVISGSTPDRKRDTKAEVLEYALSKYPEIKREECILVGDRKYDAIGASECGIDSLGVLYGHGSSDEILSSGFSLTAAEPKEIAIMLS